MSTNVQSTTTKNYSLNHTLLDDVISSGYVLIVDDVCGVEWSGSCRDFVIVLTANGLKLSNLCTPTLRASMETMAHKVFQVSQDAMALK